MSNFKSLQHRAYSQIVRENIIGQILNLQEGLGTPFSAGTGQAQFRVRTRHKVIIDGE